MQDNENECMLFLIIFIHRALHCLRRFLRTILTTMRLVKARLAREAAKAVAAELRKVKAALHTIHRAWRLYKGRIVLRARFSLRKKVLPYL